MKHFFKRYLHLTMFLALIATTLVVNPGRTYAAPSAQASLAASLEVLVPGVEILNAGTDQWLPVTGRAVVAEGDMIRTDVNGEAIVSWFDDGSIMNLSPRSEVEINEFKGNPSDENAPFRVETTLNFGRVFHGVRRLIDAESAYQVNTPSMAAAVRGTTFALNITENQETLLLVTEGTVKASQGASEQDVEGGYWLLATPNTPLPEPVTIESVINDPTVQGFIQAFDRFNTGRADQDNDGVYDYTDQCPTEAGLATYGGCLPPNPGLTDTPPATAVPLDNTNTAPPVTTAPNANDSTAIADRDGDGVSDGLDSCPDVAGTVANFGCPPR